MTAATLLQSVLPGSIRDAYHERRDRHRRPTTGSPSGAESEQDDFEHVDRDREYSYEQIDHSDTHGYNKEPRGSSALSQQHSNDKESQAPSPPQSCDGLQKTTSLSAPDLTIKDFDLLRTLGTGTFARVWLAKRKERKAGDLSPVHALKVLRKANVVKLKQTEHVRNERATLATASGHPFITKLVLTFKDKESVYMLLEYCPGGELFTYLRRCKRFGEPAAKFYASEMTLVFEFLHDQHNIVYRDLKPENILLDDRGHIKLVDFGFAKKLTNRETYTLCGTPEYLAPEIIKNTGHGMGTDWWALGILIYEFLAGQPPYWDQNPMKIYHKIVEGNLRFPSSTPISADAKDIIVALLEPSTARRLGCISGGTQSVKQHPWFACVNWDDVYSKKMDGPIVPKVKSAEDAGNFDEYPDEDEKNREEYTSSMRRQYDSMFADF